MSDVEDGRDPTLVAEQAIESYYLEREARADAFKELHKILGSFKGVWHVRHADGTTEDIVLEHGDLVEDAKGSCGQFILEFKN